MFYYPERTMQDTVFIVIQGQIQKLFYIKVIAKFITILNSPALLHIYAHKYASN